MPSKLEKILSHEPKSNPALAFSTLLAALGIRAIPAARAGGSVTGLDIAPNLLEQARKRAATEQLETRFDEGDAEDLPYKDHEFDIVLTMFGATFFWFISRSLGA
jgi:ubiquinone/menaquinone biosynthesis C-methylase UbiE